jgi:hypothetical protein
MTKIEANPPKENVFKLTLWVAAVAFAAAYVLGGPAEAPRHGARTARAVPAAQTRLAYEPARIAERDGECARLAASQAACGRARR